MAASTRYNSCGVYRSKDPIKNFKIRVKIERCSSEYPSTPEVQNAGKTSSVMEMQEFSCLDSLKAPKLELVEERVINWQEKIFNHNEVKTYSHEATCQTPLQKKYYRLLQEDRSDLSCKDVLFTYTFEDINSNHGLTNSQLSTELVSNFNRLRNRKSSSSERKTKNVINKSDLNFNPAALQQQMYPSLLTVGESMHIMALIEDDENSSAVGHSNEILLVKVCTNSKGLITIMPDFNHGKRPYQLQIPGKTDIYYYSVEHASNNITEESNKQHSKLRLTSIPNRIINHSSHEFKLPDPTVLRVYVFGEIVSTQQFEYDGLSVQSLLDLPEKWTLNSDQPIFHITQTCKTKSTPKTEMAYFSYPFEYEISCPVSHLIEENIGNLPRWPSIAFHVISSDWWQRFRTEGYGHLNVPLTAGSYTYKIQTWRPVVPSLSSKLRRLFIGGSPELSDISQVTVPATLEDSYFSRYGMRTETSGILHVRMHIVRQCLNSLEFDHYFTSSNNDMQSMQKDVAEVIEAFHRARQRMLQARDSIQF